MPGGAGAWRRERGAPLGGAAHSARRSARRAPAPPPPGGPRGVQRTGGGAPRPGRGVGFPGSLRRLDRSALVMLLVDADRPEPVRGGARELAVFLTPEPGAEVGDAAGSGGSGSRGCGCPGPRAPAGEWTNRGGGTAER